MEKGDEVKDFKVGDKVGVLEFDGYGRGKR